MEEKDTNQKFDKAWRTDYTVVAILGVVYILLFFWFTSTFNLP
ncbi:MAG: hypothetical protein U5K71_04330 [Gracilimonas sp.]|nr:hypothetical protein [Gracilimonas sp.]